MHTAFFSAIKEGDAAKVESMVEADPSLLNATDESGLGAFTVARYSRQDAIADMLLDKGVQLDIFAACMAGVKNRTVELLAQDRGLISAYSHDGWTALHLAAYFGHLDVAEVLLANAAPVDARSKNQMANTPLHAAVAGRKGFEMAGILLAHGADVNARQQGGFTALHSTAQNGDERLARLLISLGADVQARAENGQNAMDLAMGKGHQAIVTLLAEHGAE